MTRIGPTPLLWCLIVLSATVGLAVSQTDDDVCLTSSLNGQIRGQLLTSPSGKQVCGFYGIPFAKPPIGDLRFKRPVPFGNWDGALNATILPNMCAQNKSLTLNKGMGHERAFPEISEDCLYLNIWAPLSIFQSPSKSAAVMIWIHGGGFFAGSISEPLINNPILAGENDVIVAFMQYRLGPLGSIYFGTEEAPGNVGALDQYLAIKWLSENIHGFGGDKEQVTLFGESAGSFSVSYHSLSPLTRQYFKRGILLSGAAGAQILWRSKQAALDFSYEVAEHAGCYSKEQNSPEDVSEIIACMRTKDKFLITYSSYEPKFFGDIEAGFTVDDYFLLDTPENLLKDPANSQVDLMIGTTRDEGSYLLMIWYKEYFEAGKWPSFTFEEQQRFFRLVFSNKPAFEQDAIITHYTNWENFNDGTANALSIVDSIGDHDFVCPSVELAQKWTKNGRKVYFYWFTHTKEDSYLCSDWMGACHGSELEYVFGMPLRDPSSPQHERELSRNIQTLFIKFAKTGIPSDNWSEYTSSNPVYLDLNGTVISDISPHNIYGPRPHDCSFWNVELPRLRKLAGDGGGDDCPTNPPPNTRPTTTSRSSDQNSTPNNAICTTLPPISLFSSLVMFALANSVWTLVV